MPITQNALLTRWSAQVLNLTTGVASSPFGSYSTYMRALSKVGERRPGWKKLIRKLIEAGTSYYVSYTSADTLLGVLTCNYKNIGISGNRYRQTVRGDLARGGSVPPFVPPIVDTSATDIQARMGFLKKVDRAEAGFQSGVFLGELRETIRTITKPGKAIRGALDDYYRNVKKRSKGLRGTRAVNRAVAGSWLETSFAIKPMLMDVDNAMETIAGSSLVYDQPISYTAKNTTRQQYADANCGYSGVGGCQFRYTPVLETDILVKYKGLVAWESQNNAGSWQKTWGLTPRDFIPTVYELIPYSWLVDYFSNLGEVVNGLCNGDVQLRWGCRVVKGQAKWLIINPRVHQDNPNYPEWEGNVSLDRPPDIQRFDYSRQVIDRVGLGISDLRLDLPGSWMKWANVGALAAMRTL